ncbi:Cupredoxin, partial [Bombardia bombarda]
AGLVMQASATTIRVDVGKTGLTFDPNVITAGVGDVLEFHFYPRNHSVVSGLWTQACIPPASGGFYTGFFPTANNTVNSQVFRVTINDTDPHVFYCSQNTGAHCRNGMVGVVNPFGSNTLEFYVGLARGALTAVSPPSAFGGTIAQANASASTTSASGGSGASSSTSSAAS